MRETFLFAMLDKFRERLLMAAEQCPSSKRAFIPAGFNNHVLWHLGHVLTVTDGLVIGLAGEAKQLPAAYQTLFGNGSKPAEWSGEAPAWETLASQLKEQPEKIKAVFAGKLQAPVKENFAKAETVGELLQVCLIHESNHTGTISAMAKLLK